ncbi:hypothetical protein [Kitasatospora griseola]|uniref:hypothetical protein n=1 Tax=Kitasatospora griseola TaxID=2064 RepID=UPI00381AEC1B
MQRVPQRVVGPENPLDLRERHGLDKSPERAAELEGRAVPIVPVAQALAEIHGPIMPAGVRTDRTARVPSPFDLRYEPGDSVKTAGTDSST